MAKLLKSWKQQCAWERQQAGETLQENDYLFRQPNGDPMVPTTFTFRFKKILRQNGLPENLNVHSLRHPYVKHTTKKYRPRINLGRYFSAFIQDLPNYSRTTNHSLQCYLKYIHRI